MAELLAAERLLRHDRLLVIGGLSAAIALSWAYLLTGAGMDVHQMDGMLMPMAGPEWTLGTFGVTLLMWAVMMAAMMLPSAAPTILLHATISARSRAKGGRAASTGVFAAGYVAVWSAFSLGAVLLQFALDRAALVSPMMQVTSVGLAGAVLISAGVYQWTPLKQACLRHCRSPLEFLSTQWCQGNPGAFSMGLRHGSYCLGCCWVLMLLLFVGGVMNLAWIAGLALFVLLEKLAPAGHWAGKVAGLALVGWGAATLASLVQ
jgi:predicted metal-binding membrane protein